MTSSFIGDVAVTVAVRRPPPRNRDLAEEIPRGELVQPPALARHLGRSLFDDEEEVAGVALCAEHLAFLDLPFLEPVREKLALVLAEGGEERLRLET
jgi:hypothetical protein